MLEKSSRFQTLKQLLSGRGWDRSLTKLIKNDATIDDGHPLQGIMIVFRIFREDSSKNSIRKIGSSRYLLISEETEKLICDGQGHLKNPILHGYNEVNGHHYAIIDCGPKGGDKLT